MLFRDWIWPILKTSCSAAVEGSAMIEAALCVALFWLPALLKACFGFEGEQPNCPFGKS
jgi:hypothetical protein